MLTVKLLLDLQQAFAMPVWGEQLWLYKGCVAPAMMQSAIKVCSSHTDQMFMVCTMSIALSATY